MTYNQFLDQIIDNGIEGAKRDYAKPEQKMKLRGAIAGFSICRREDPHGLQSLLKMAQESTQQARSEKSEDYLYYRCYEAEIEWVCNCVSALLYYNHMPVIVQPTARAAMAIQPIVAGQHVIFEPNVDDQSGDSCETQ